jgi:hypothetical protein
MSKPLSAVDERSGESASYGRLRHNPRLSLATPEARCPAILPVVWVSIPDTWMEHTAHGAPNDQSAFYGASLWQVRRTLHHRITPSLP